MFEVDKYSRTPIYEQIIDITIKMIADGELKENDLLPSVRTLSQDLSVNPNTLQKAYVELERRGLCYSVPGSGRFISKDAKMLVRGYSKELLREITDLCQELKRRKVPLNEVISIVEAVYVEEK